VSLPGAGKRNVLSLKRVSVKLEVFGKLRKSVVPPFTCAPHPATPHSQTLVGKPFWTDENS
jgi:hypothetical protein